MAEPETTSETPTRKVSTELIENVRSNPRYTRGMVTPPNGMPSLDESSIPDWNKMTKEALAEIQRIEAIPNFKKNESLLFQYNRARFDLIPNLSKYDIHYSFLFIKHRIESGDLENPQFELDITLTPDVFNGVLFILSRSPLFLAHMTIEELQNLNTYNQFLARKFAKENQFEQNLRQCDQLLSFIQETFNHIEP